MMKRITTASRALAKLSTVTVNHSRSYCDPKPDMRLFITCYIIKKNSDYYTLLLQFMDNYATMPGFPIEYETFTKFGRPTDNIKLVTLISLNGLVLPNLNYPKLDTSSYPMWHNGDFGMCYSCYFDTNYKTSHNAMNDMYYHNHHNGIRSAQTTLEIEHVCQKLDYLFDNTIKLDDDLYEIDAASYRNPMFKLLLLKLDSNKLSVINKDVRQHSIVRQHIAEFGDRTVQSDSLKLYIKWAYLRLCEIRETQFFF